MVERIKTLLIILGDSRDNEPMTNQSWTDIPDICPTMKRSSYELDKQMMKCSADKYYPNIKNHSLEED